jgi:mannose/cellobiose epimerase-like protein (N-acyl-D-glucosamine 2-epimerase family)
MALGRHEAGLAWVLAFACGCGGTESEELGRTTQPDTLAILKASVQVTSTWQNGYCANVNVTNGGTATASTWTVVLELNAATLANTWNGNFTGSGSRKSITPVAWNGTVTPGGTQSFGYCANFKIGATNYRPTVISPLGQAQGSGGASGSGSAGATSGAAGSGGSPTAGGPAGGAAGSGGVSFSGMGGVAVGGTSGATGAAGGVAMGGYGGVATAGNGGVSLGGAGGTLGGFGGQGGAGTGGLGGYMPTGDYLVNPNHAVDMVKSLADFRAKSRDDVNGGFYTFVNIDGTVSSDHRKGFVTTTRDAWTFSRAFMLTGDEKYLDDASHALDFLFAHGWDKTNGGWYFTADQYGNLTPYQSGWDPNTWKWSFVQHYELLGIGANCDATRDATVCAWLQKGRGYLDSKMWDAKASELGYYEQTNLNWSNPINKSFTATVDALTTNGIQAALLWPATYDQRMVDLANIVVDRLSTAMDLSNVKLGFPENYNTSWGVNTGSTGADIGHVLKSAWVLARVYFRHPDARYRAAARKFIYDVLNNGGWDDVHGMPYTHYEWNTGQVTKQAECWQIEQAVTSGLSNWYIADNQADKDAFMKMADRALQFFVTYVVDHTNGGTYKLNQVTGEPADGKSNFFNAEYHSTELFYFAYLYGNLLLYRTPVALYYRLAASSSQQVIQLNPLAIDDASALSIQAVTLDGTPLTTFNATTREITLAPGQGGKLRVVFAPAH